MVQRAAAYCLASNLVWHLRYIRSEHNPTDFASRAADRGELGAGETVSASRRAVEAVLSPNPPKARHPPAGISMEWHG
eukprot:6469769-Amphidinium_carterae.1